MAPKVGFISLGCPKALVDTEQILSRLETLGYESVEGTDAEVVVVNTCGFIDDAIDESLATIEHSLKQTDRVIVTGCLGANAARLRERFPELASITGPAAVDDVVSAVQLELPAPCGPDLPEHMQNLGGQEVGVKLTPPHYAYLKISEGCNHSCSFCIIPSMRGKLRSRGVADVLDEAEELVDSGVRELLVISQDTSAYGVDIRYRTETWRGEAVQSRIVELARRLGELTPWVRLHYVYPYPHVDRLIELMADGTILPYVDVPLQHAAPSVLTAMRRPGSIEGNLERIERWRATCPDLTIRSTFIVGFPGETERDFDLLLEFLRAAELDRVGAFAYSPVEGAAANQLPGAVSESEKQNRLQAFMSAQEQVSAGRIRRWLGRDLEVIVDSVDQTGSYCRGWGDAPEIDGQVIVPNTQLCVGELTHVRITSADAHDLTASHVGNPVKIY